MNNTKALVAYEDGYWFWTVTQNWSEEKLLGFIEGWRGVNSLLRNSINLHQLPQDLDEFTDPDDGLLTYISRDSKQYQEMIKDLKTVIPELNNVCN